MKLTTDIFLITFPDDYQWLPFLFRSIARHVMGFDRLVVVVEEGDEPPLALLQNSGVRAWEIERCRRYRGTSYPGYTGQAIEKLRAWHYTDAERVMFIDSDCVFTRPLDLQTDPHINLAKPIVWWRQWNEAGPALCWKESTDQILGFSSYGETMCRHPFVFPGWMLHLLWERIGGEERLFRFPRVSDFNLMGNFAFSLEDQVGYSEDMFTLNHWPPPPPAATEADHARLGEAIAVEVPGACVRQFWSRKGVTVEVEEEMRKMELMP